MKTLAPGEPIPDFEAPDQENRIRRSVDYRGRWLVIYFYLRDETPVCTSQATNFTARGDDFHARNAAILGISSDTPRSHARFARHCSVTFPLVSDPEHRIQRAFGVRALYGMTKRVTFLVDPSGRVVDTFRDEFRGRSHVQWALQRLHEVGADAARA